MTAGTITVVVDSRLNRLIVQGTVSDIERVENYLKIIDKDSSITSIETYGSSHVIELTYTKANVVADAIRQVFVGRVLAATSVGQPNQQGTAQQAQRKPTAEKSENDQEQSKGKKAAAAKKPAGQSVRNFEPKMTIAVHEPSNSLIVTCPNQMFEEVERLVNVIDSRSKQTVEVIATSNSEVYQELLRQVQGQSIGSGSKQQPSTSRSPTRRPPPTASPMPSSSPSSNSKGRQ
jgi:type II secretory pathway component GspD/PulD (secretin)